MKYYLKNKIVAEKGAFQLADSFFYNDYMNEFRASGLLFIAQNTLIEGKVSVKFRNLKERVLEQLKVVIKSEHISPELQKKLDALDLLIKDINDVAEKNRSLQDLLRENVINSLFDKLIEMVPIITKNIIDQRVMADKINYVNRNRQKQILIARLYQEKKLVPSKTIFDELRQLGLLG